MKNLIRPSTTGSPRWADNQQFKDKKAVLLEGRLWDNGVVATLPGWRTDF